MSYELPMVYGDYRITIGTSIDPAIEQDVYLITNVVTGIIEGESSSLPRAIMSAQSSSMALIRLLDDKEPSITDLYSLEAGMDYADGGNNGDGGGNQPH